MTALEFGGTTVEWTDFTLLFCMVSTPTLGLSFIITELYLAKDPLVPFSLLKYRQVAVAITCNALTMAAYVMVRICYYCLYWVASTNIWQSIYLITFDIQASMWNESGAPGSGLSFLYAGLGLGFLIGGFIVRRSGRIRLVVMAGTCTASLCYALIFTGIAREYYLILS